VNISDAVYLIAYIFGGGPAPCEAPKGYLPEGQDWTLKQMVNYLQQTK